MVNAMGGGGGWGSITHLKEISLRASNRFFAHRLQGDHCGCGCRCGKNNSTRTLFFCEVSLAWKLDNKSDALKTSTRSCLETRKEMRRQSILKEPVSRAYRP